MTPTPGRSPATAANDGINCAKSGVSTGLLGSEMIQFLVTSNRGEAPRGAELQAYNRIDTAYVPLPVHGPCYYWREAPYGAPVASHSRSLAVGGFPMPAFSHHKPAAPFTPAHAGVGASASGAR
jgi:hypothetical protein